MRVIGLGKSTKIEYKETRFIQDSIIKICKLVKYLSRHFGPVLNLQSFSGVKDVENGSWTNSFQIFQESSGMTAIGVRTDGWRRRRRRKMVERRGQARRK